MTDLNTVILFGRLTKDEELGYLGNGTAKGSLSLAVNRSKKVNDKWENEVSFFDVTLWGKQAENLKQYLVKGSLVAISGFLKQDRWEKDGQKFSKVSIVAENIQLCGGKSGESSDEVPPQFKKFAKEIGGEVQKESGDFPEDLGF